MSIRDLKDKAMSMLGKHSDKANQGIDKAADAAKSQFGQYSGKIDDAANRAKGFVGDEQDGEQGGQDGGTEQDSGGDGRSGSHG